MMLLRRLSVAEKLLQGSRGGGGGGTTPLLKLGGCSAFTSRSAAASLQSACKDSDSYEEYADINWDELGFGLVPTDYMYVTRCSRGGGGANFAAGELSRYGNIELSPSAGILNYGQGVFEGLKAYRKEDGRGLLLFRPEENALRMQMGAERMCMPSPSVEQFVAAVKRTVLANKRWVPPPGKGALYVRPLLMGSGAVLGLAPAPEYTFLIYASPVGNYFKEGMNPIHLLIGDGVHRAAPGGTGAVKTVVNYAPLDTGHQVARARSLVEAELRHRHWPAPVKGSSSSWSPSWLHLVAREATPPPGTRRLQTPLSEGRRMTGHGRRHPRDPGGISAISSLSRNPRRNLHDLMNSPKISA